MRNLSLIFVRRIIHLLRPSLPTDDLYTMLCNAVRLTDSFPKFSNEIRHPGESCNTFIKAFIILVVGAVFFPVITPLFPGEKNVLDVSASEDRCQWVIFECEDFDHSFVIFVLVLESSVNPCVPVDRDFEEGGELMENGFCTMMQ